MKSQRGFTLIEALFSGTIALILPTVVIAIMKVSSSQLASNANGLRLTQIANSISEDIHRSALAATYVYSWDDPITPATCPPADPASTSPLSGVVFYDQACTVIKGFRIVRLESPYSHLGKVQEWLDGDWRTIKFSGDSVTVTYSPALEGKLGGLFGIFSKGDFLWYNLRFEMTLSGTPATLPLQTGSVVCRNAPSRTMSW